MVQHLELQHLACTPNRVDCKDQRSLLHPLQQDMSFISFLALSTQASVGHVDDILSAVFVTFCSDNLSNSQLLTKWV